MSEGHDATRICAQCGLTNKSTSRFCGGCGAALETLDSSLRVEPKEDAIPFETAAESPVSYASTQKKSRAPAVFGGVIGALGLGILGAVFFLSTSQVDEEDLVESSTTSSNRSDTRPDRDAEESVSKGDTRSEEQKRPDTRFSKKAKDVDDPDDFPYLEKRVSCSQHAHLTDVVKGVGHEVDRELRNATKISGAEEQRYGKKVLGAVEKQLDGTLVRRSEMVSYLADIAKPMLAHVKRKDIDYDFYVLKDTEVKNAFALPGGHIVFTQPLLDSWIENEAQLAAIVGHEIAHVDLRHCAAKMQYLKALGLDPEDELGQAAIHFGQMPWSSGFEEASDAWGAELMQDVGYSVFQAVSLWSARAGDREAAKPTEQEEEGGLVGAMIGTVLDEVENLIISHPDAERRACLLRQEAYDLYQSDPIDKAYVGKRNWSRKTPMSKAVF